MFLLPNWLIYTVTFPGVIIHELAHELFCILFGVKVTKSVYFQMNSDVAGYIEHEQPTTLNQLFWISAGPLVLNSILAIVLSHRFFAYEASYLIQIITIWLAFSVGLQAFPSNQDAKNIISDSKELGGGITFSLISYPFFALIWLANFLKYFWFDIAYALLMIWLGFII